MRLRTQQAFIHEGVNWTGNESPQMTTLPRAYPNTSCLRTVARLEGDIVD